MENLSEKIIEFLRDNYQQALNRLSVEETNSIIIDFSDLERYDVELANGLLEKPEEIIKEFEKTIKEMDILITEEQKEKLKVRFRNLPESRSVRIRDIRERHLNKFIVVDGIVKRASEIRPEIYMAFFECLKCGMISQIEQKERTITPPKKCEFCRESRSFIMVNKKLRDSRWIVVEDPFEIRGGESPSELFVYLSDDLVDIKNRNKTDPGNRIKICGILKDIPKKMRGKYARQMEVYLDANYFENVETQWEDLEITEEDEKRIIELAKSNDIYEKIVKSIAPSIFGHNEIKMALALQMFGGVEKFTKDNIRIRGDINILLIGEPATAKSQFLKFVSQIMPRARYVSGKAATTAGLIATVTRDEEFLGGWVLEAGAIVLANRSICCIDEFEKIDKKDITALHEGLEQGTISIAKASIIATLPAKTAVLAAANPKYSRFDEMKPISEQIDIAETILTRFDIKFALRDVPDFNRDKEMIEYIERVRYFDEDSAKPAIDLDLLRKYIAYARKNVFPRLSKEAAEKIKSFFLELRKNSFGGVVSITARQYESLVRLAEASARIQLREYVNEEDAQRAINLMLFSLRQFGQDISGMIDIDKAEGQKITHEHRSKIKIIESIIEELEKKYPKGIPIDEVIKGGKEAGIGDVENIINKMREVGDLFSPTPDKIQRVRR